MRAIATSGSGTGAVATTDTFNIQGWLTARAAKKGTTNIFSMSLGYYTPTISGNGTVPDARYSGDISSWSWTHGNGSSAVVRSYGFIYDGAHRLIDARFYAGTTANTITDRLSERNMAYDRAGNLTALTRYNNSSSPVATSLTYGYVGNRRSSYSYDDNGNVTSDATNNLQSSYNLLNLPAQIKSGSTVKANYTYLSDGTKTAAFTSASAGKDYAGSFTYSRGDGGSKTLESVAFGGGRIRKSGSTYAVDYHITDHLGSVRAIVNASGTVVEQNDYYPFGTRHSNGLTQLAANRWRFSGKEEQDAAFGIAYSDFGTRLYDRSASWTAIDPLAEKYYAVSPYVYCNNNPICFIDYNGLVWDNPLDAFLLEENTTMRILEYNMQKDILQTLVDTNIFSDKDVLEFQSRIDEFDKRIALLLRSINDIHLLSSDPEHTYVLDPILRDEHHVRSRSGKVYIETSSDALSLHEISHVRQSLEIGSLRFNASGMLLIPGNNINRQINNEVEAYKIQFSFDPSSFPGALYGASGVDGVNRFSVINIRSNGKYVYPFK